MKCTVSTMETSHPRWSPSWLRGTIERMQINIKPMFSTSKKSWLMQWQHHNLHLTLNRWCTSQLDVLTGQKKNKMLATIASVRSCKETTTMFELRKYCQISHTTEVSTKCTHSNIVHDIWMETNQKAESSMAVVALQHIMLISLSVFMEQTELCVHPPLPPLHPVLWL